MRKRCKTRVKHEENERDRDDSENEKRPEMKQKWDEMNQRDEKD